MNNTQKSWEVSDMALYSYQSESKFYKDKLILLEKTRDKLQLRLDESRKDYTLRGLVDPVEHYKTRIKSVKSMKEKLQRKGHPVTLDAALSQIYDAVGMRIVCTFINDIYTIRDWFINQTDTKIIMEKDYIKSPKPNGYRSYHIIIEIPVNKVAVYAEIQIRTLAMDCWASLEHKLKYKHEILHQKMIVDELKRFADEIASTDINLQAIKELIVSPEMYGMT